MAESEALLGGRIQRQSAAHCLNNDVRISGSHSLGYLVQVADLDVYADLRCAGIQRRHVVPGAACHKAAK